MSTPARKPSALTVIAQALGRQPTPQELINLAPFAVAVQAFFADDSVSTLSLDVGQHHEQWLCGLLGEVNDQWANLRIDKGLPFHVEVEVDEP